MRKTFSTPYRLMCESNVKRNAFKNESAVFNNVANLECSNCNVSLNEQYSLFYKTFHYRVKMNKTKIRADNVTTEIQYITTKLPTLKQDQLCGLQC